MNTPELSFECSIEKSKFGELWIGRCESLNICTQGDNEQDAMMAIIDAIGLRLTAPTRRQNRRGSKATRINISLAQVMEVTRATSASATSA